MCKICLSMEFNVILAIRLIPNILARGEVKKVWVNRTEMTLDECLTSLKRCAVRWFGRVGLPASIFTAFRRL